MVMSHADGCSAELEQQLAAAKVQCGALQQSLQTVTAQISYLADAILEWANRVR